MTAGFGFYRVCGVKYVSVTCKYIVPPCPRFGPRRRWRRRRAGGRAIGEGLPEGRGGVWRQRRTLVALLPRCRLSMLPPPERLRRASFCQKIWRHMSNRVEPLSFVCLFIVLFICLIFKYIYFWRLTNAGAHRRLVLEAAEARWKLTPPLVPCTSASRHQPADVPLRRHSTPQ